MKIRDGAMAGAEEVFADNGEFCTYSTAATYTGGPGGKLVVASVFKQTIVCDVKYLTD